MKKKAKKQAGLEMKYFVLKPRGKDAYAKASRHAMSAYSRMIMKENPELSRELFDWAARESLAANEKTLKKIYEASSDGRSAFR